MSSIQKNNAESTFQKVSIEDSFKILTHQNNTDEVEILTEETHRDFIQFHFCLKGSAKFNFNEGSYSLNLGDEKALLLYNPIKDLPLHVEVSPKSWLVCVLVSIQKLHSLFSEEADYIHFLTEENMGKKYYQEQNISPSMAVVLSQILNFNLHPSVKKIYLKGKAYELIGLYFNRPEEADIEQCPFLVDEENVRKIRKAKEIVINRMAEPPSLQELSDEIGLSLKKLKEGFKEIYGETVFGFLFDYKMDYARKLLETGQHNVNEVGLRVGYSTASHFIAAFKKKFGTTPKKYILSLPISN
ncbi:MULTISPECIES: AraC family transcriptional regulator [Mesonia]|uniref:AraC family transcriptional regulator n=1 Tax=Mesonia TaxID=232115 RepID=UPI00176A8617|nr:MULTISPECIES: AraC family transcriptional regulator [Mesonia]HIB36210.1 AraC family transcriptional regulator [Mesonia sp.]HIO26521.1 AraC family transcriptional regulator [Flavobacteriaceae bacterium]|tara:strand:+ start:154 stop:1053 length:900 start_codon:yes stop_codon:yes gene_type:complete